MRNTLLPYTTKGQPSEQQQQSGSSSSIVTAFPHATYYSKPQQVRALSSTRTLRHIRYILENNPDVALTVANAVFQLQAEKQVLVTLRFIT